MEHSRMDCSGTGSGSCCERNTSESVPVRQTLSEMDFERGIWYAAQNNDCERVEKLLAKGISANAQDGAGYTALHYASRAGNLEICKKLVQYGADVNAATRSGIATSLHRSAMRGLDDVVQYLLKCGANPHLQDSDGYTPLHRAILASSLTVCRLLIPLSDLDISDNKSRNPRQLALEQGTVEIIELFQTFEKT
ncbi:ankyrin repeat domain-containing protein 39-like isoform X2 [Venturia canescens]|nr:ankyrin repeat domain-containing protein 39-like isoform X2 [Venturia canescens]XP_043276435.1 ankyrin repeat domain-containing protein 39-like isoform X2 [Venturia canescens]XP_043276436.1 ankyrin repeat domain-containing protein 39-like isoform X2 [Venturia canescens]XP_043276437.1 ankyrin repeat domain-containing protein 39-like isoform X2 [Venturia canescens]XP_043276438.1 ankyrin repeat domain-containing protein 39-like isoform X2 [Venturia canescens]